MLLADVRTLAVVFSLVVAPAAQQLGDPEVHHLALVAAPTQAVLAKLVALDLDLAACTPLALGAKEVEVIATDADLRVLEAAGLAFSVSIRNLEAYHARELSKNGPFRGGLTPSLGQGSMGGHYTWAQVVAHLDRFAAEHPSICAPKVSLGKSVEGRDIWMVKISDNVGDRRERARGRTTTLIHQRAGTAVAGRPRCSSWTELLDGYGTDPEVTYIVEQRELYFVPVVNPDGYEYNRRTNPGGGGMWRKNRRDNGGGVFGVDLNRNYATGFGGGGSSGNRSSSTYRGPRAFSEPETAAVEQFVRARSFVQSFSSHSYTDVLLRPWDTGLATRPTSPTTTGWAEWRPGPVESATAARGRSCTRRRAPRWTTITQPMAASVGRRSWVVATEGGFWPNFGQHRAHRHAAPADVSRHRAAVGPRSSRRRDLRYVQRRARDHCGDRHALATAARPPCCWSAAARRTRRFPGSPAPCCWRHMLWRGCRHGSSGRAVI